MCTRREDEASGASWIRTEKLDFAAINDGNTPRKMSTCQYVVASGEMVCLNAKRGATMDSTTPSGAPETVGRSVPGYLIEHPEELQAMAVGTPPH